MFKIALQKAAIHPAQAVALALMFAVSVAQAEDSVAVTEVNAAKASALLVAGALVSMGVAIWGAMYLYRKFFK